MYTIKRQNKSIILLLLIINFILLGTLAYSTPIKAEYQDIGTKENYYEPTGEIMSREEMIGSEMDTIEYEVIEGETIVVSRLKAERLEQLKQEAIERKREEERQAAIMAMKTVESSRAVSASSINIHTDLSVMNTINADDINKIIDYWDSKSSGTIPFKGQGQVFIDASKESGLDPIYILSHASLESGWGAKNMSHNYFGIGAFDSNPNNGHNYGNSSLRDGIINGAIWISKNYYNNGQTTLYSMRYNDGKHEYCTSESWAPDISSIMRLSYSLIE